MLVPPPALVELLVVVAVATNAVELENEGGPEDEAPEKETADPRTDVGSAVDRRSAVRAISSGCNLAAPPCLLCILVDTELMVTSVRGQSTTRNRTNAC